MRLAFKLFLPLIAIAAIVLYFALANAGTLKGYKPLRCQFINGMAWTAPDADFGKDSYEIIDRGPGDRPGEGWFYVRNPRTKRVCLYAFNEGEGWACTLQCGLSVNSPDAKSPP